MFDGHCCIKKRGGLAPGDPHPLKATPLSSTGCAPPLISACARLKAFPSFVVHKIAIRSSCFAFSIATALPHRFRLSLSLNRRKHDELISSLLVNSDRILSADEARSRMGSEVFRWSSRACPVELHAGWGRNSPLSIQKLSISPTSQGCPSRHSFQGSTDHEWCKPIPNWISENRREKEIGVTEL